MGNYLFPLTLKGEQVDVSVCLRFWRFSRSRRLSLSAGRTCIRWRAGPLKRVGLSASDPLAAPLRAWSDEEVWGMKRLPRSSSFTQETFPPSPRAPNCYLPHIMPGSGWGLLVVLSLIQQNNPFICLEIFLKVKKRSKLNLWKLKNTLHNNGWKPLHMFHCTVIIMTISKDI